MSDRLPSLNALRAFEAAARHMSFRKAAAELHVTPTAISHQIKGLEDFLDVSLFHRLNRGLALTEAGQAGLPKLQQGFSLLKESMQKINDFCDEDQTLTVWSPPSFTAKWLIPRLRRFAEKYPGIDLNVSSNDSQLDINEITAGEIADELHRKSVDLSVRFGHGDYPGCRVDKLFSASLAPLCSPQLLEGPYPLKSPEDLRYHTLIHDDTAYAGRPDWKDWLESAGVKGIDASHGLRFNHVSLALQAAAEGQGVALGLQPLAADDIASGRLVIPFEIDFPLPHAYYLVCPEELAEHRNVIAFRHWLLEEARGCCHSTRQKEIAVDNCA